MPAQTDSASIEVYFQGQSTDFLEAVGERLLEVNV